MKLLWNIHLYLLKIVFHDIHPDFAVRDEFDPLNGRIGIHGDGDRLLTVIDKDLGAESVEDHTESEFTVTVADPTPALMDHRPPGSGELAVDLHDRIGRMETQ